jgi:N-acyl homoserine lactone hydrolase
MRIDEYWFRRACRSIQLKVGRSIPDPPPETPMTRINQLNNFVLPTLAVLVFGLSLSCAASHHTTRAGTLGEASSSAAMEAMLEKPGPIRFERVIAADWEVPRSGLINLEHPRAVAAGLKDRSEPIHLFLYVLEHPTRGTFIVDSGVESGFREAEGNPRVGFLVESAMNTESLVVHTTTAEWLTRSDVELSGVFVTHLHLDHVMGLPDVPSSASVYVGPGETSATNVLNLFSRGTIDAMLGNANALEVWPFEGDPTGQFSGVVDIFGDGSVWALHVPGHSPGSTAFLVRSTEGPKLLVGDASHTRWGWENDVEPGTFTADHEANAASLAALRSLSARFPDIEVHLGHQTTDFDFDVEMKSASRTATSTEK